jgi:anthranilate phosphoribosyltransferase
LNAGAAMYVAGVVDSLEQGVTEADAALEDGRGLEALERLRDATRAAGAKKT